MAASAQVLPFPTRRPSYDAPSTAVPANDEGRPGMLPISRLKKQYTGYLGAKYDENLEAN